MATSGRFIPEQPVGKLGDVLLGGTQLGAQLDRVAAHIIASARSETPSPSITFLVSGKWGSGKSSALKYVRDSIEEAEGSAVIFADYPAPLFDITPANARATLMYVLVRALDAYATTNSGNGQLRTPAPSLLAGLLTTVFSKGDVPKAISAPTATDQAHLRDVQNQVLLIEALGSSTISGVVLEHWLSEYQHTRADRKPTTVVFVDDLDRCSTKFATDVLVATNFWSQLPGHFFVLGADEARLRLALAENLDRAIGAPDRGLHKYVHFTIEVASALGGTKVGKSLFADLLKRVDFIHADKALLEDQVALVGDDPFGPLAVLEPIVNAQASAVADAYTPRDLKERFNALVSRLDVPSPEPSVPQSVSLEELKRQVVQLVWPEEWRDRLLPAHLGDAAARAWCSQFLHLGELALAEPRRAQAQIVERLAGTSGLVMDRADPMLAVYLASEPQYSVVTEPKPPTTPALDVVLPSSKEEVTALRRGLALPALSDPTSANFPGVDDDGQERALNQLVNELYLVADIGDDENRMHQLFNEIVSILPAIDLGPSFAASLGNTALRLGRHPAMLREAAQMHWLAVQADPQHPNVNQNFVDFVVDHPIRELFEPAEQALTRLVDDPAMRGWKPMRTRYLRFAFATAVGKEPPESYESITSALAAAEDDIDTTDLLRLVTFADRYGAWRASAVIAERMIRDDSDPRVRALTIRLVADTTAASPNSADEEFAAELYRFFFLSGLASQLDVDDTGDGMFNFGILMASRGLARRSWYLFWEAFARNPNDDRIRLRLARAYNDNGNSAVAERLISGPAQLDELPAPPGAPFEEPLLPRSDDARQWLAVAEGTYGPPLLTDFFAVSPRIGGSPDGDLQPGS